MDIRKKLYLEQLLYSNDSLAFCAIPKNSLRKITDHLLINSFFECSTISGIPSFAVLRDPVDRYYSGIAEYYLRLTGDKQTTELFEEFIKQYKDTHVKRNDLFLDEHTYPQTKILKYYNIFPTYTYMYDKQGKYINDINVLLGKNNIPLLNDKILYKSPVYLKLLVKSYLQYNEDNIKEYYKDDINFISKIK